MSIKDYDFDYNSYEKARYKYENSNVVSKLITRLTGRVPMPPETLRFAVKYGDIGMPFRKDTFHDGFRDAPGWEEHSIDPILDENDDSIDDLWTVVEYEGEDVFVDLVTGMRFRLSFPKDIINDTMSRYDRFGKDRVDNMSEGYDTVRKMYYGYAEVPLAIADERKLTGLTADIKKSIMEETVPLKDKITERLGDKEEVARKAVEDELKDDVDKYGQQYDELIKKILEQERVEREIEEDRRRAFEERRRKEELEKMTEEEKSRLIDPAFNEMFGPTKKK